MAGAGIRAPVVLLATEGNPIKFPRIDGELPYRLGSLEIITPSGGIHSNKGILQSVAPNATGEPPPAADGGLETAGSWRLARSDG